MLQAQMASWRSYEAPGAARLQEERLKPWMGRTGIGDILTLTIMCRLIGVICLDRVHVHASYTSIVRDYMDGLGHIGLRSVLTWRGHIIIYSREVKDHS